MRLLVWLMLGISVMLMNMLLVWVMLAGLAAGMGLVAESVMLWVWIMFQFG